MIGLLKSTKGVGGRVVKYVAPPGGGYWVKHGLTKKDLLAHELAGEESIYRHIREDNNVKALVFEWVYRFAMDDMNRVYQREYEGYYLYSKKTKMVRGKWCWFSPKKNIWYYDE